MTQLNILSLCMRKGKNVPKFTLPLLPKSFFHNYLVFTIFLTKSLHI